MYQQITFVGRLGADPEMRYTPSGVPVTNFNVAVNKRWTSQDGQQQEKTTWFRVAAWRQLAEVCSRYLTKGRQVLVVGEMDEARAWTDQEGNPRASLEVTARTVQFLGSRDDIMPVDEAGRDYSSNSDDGEPDISGEDIPF